MPRVAVVVAAVALAAALGGCGEADEPASAPATPSAAQVELTIVHDDGRGERSTGTLTCADGETRAEGALRDRATAAKLCAQARRVASFLTSTPPGRRVCSQIYGGPETARITGTIDGETVDRRLKRTNGCEIADFKRVAGLLQP